MARAHETERPAQAAQHPEAAPVTAEASGPATTFTGSGPLPAVQTAPSAAQPTASERAYGPAKGPGLQALEALLAKGPPAPGKVVELIDTHRDETAAMFAALESSLGAAYVANVRTQMDRLRASVSRREVVAGDPTDPTGGFFIGSQAEQGARWRTEGGRFSGTANKDGLDSTVRLDDDDALHARVGKDGAGTLAWERDGKNQGELYGRYKGGNDHEAGLRRTWDLEGGGAMTAGVRHRATADGTTDGVFGWHRTADGRTTTEAALGVGEGELAASAGITHQLTPRDTVSAALAQDHHGTTVQASGRHAIDGGSVSGSARLRQGPDGTTGQLAAAYQQDGTRVDGNVTRAAESTSMHLGASQQVSPELLVSGNLDHTNPDRGPSQTTLGLSERYRSGDVVHGASLEVGHGARDYFRSTGSLDAQLGRNLYGGAWGSYQVEQGQHGTAELGASLTFTTGEKHALTLAGVLDQDGALATQLQFDVFKSRISGVADIADHKRDALVSLFVSYSQSGDRRALDNRYGAPQASGELGERVMAGIKIKF